MILIMIRRWAMVRMTTFSMVNCQVIRRYWFSAPNFYLSMPCIKTVLVFFKPHLCLAPKTVLVFFNAISCHSWAPESMLVYVKAPGIWPTRELKTIVRPYHRYQMAGNFVTVTYRRPIASGETRLWNPNSSVSMTDLLCWETTDTQK